MGSRADKCFYKKKHKYVFIFQSIFPNRFGGLIQVWTTSVFYSVPIPCYMVVGVIKIAISLLIIMIDLVRFYSKVM